MNEEKKASEKLIELIRTMPETEAEKVYYLIQGVRVGETTAAKATA